jgi:NTP pyrophosphatase (non-canonical NTP hydrolase)
MTQNGRLESLSADLEAFADERDWQQFHNPKNLSMALAVEVAEIMEILQWMTGDESANLNARKKSELSEELGDSLIYLIRLADMAEIDLIEAAEAKLAQNRDKYPADLVRGSSKKYSEY